jgi:hypothetical protein
VVNTGDVSFRTDAVPTVADITFSPGFNHGNVWNTQFARDREVWVRIGTPPVTAGMTVQLMTANQTTFAPAYQLIWSPGGQFQIDTNTPTGSASTNLGFGPSAGDWMCLQHQFPYVFAWQKFAAGAWRLILATVCAIQPNSGWIGMFYQNPGTNLTVDEFGGGAFDLMVPNAQNVNGHKRAWAGRS